MKPPLYLITDGDSLTFGTGPDAGKDYPRQLSWLYPDNRMVAISNMATAGQEISNLITTSPLEVDQQYDSRKGTNIIVCWCGLNDLRRQSVTPAVAYANLQTYCAARRAVGFKVIVCTLTPTTIAGTPASYEPDRQTFNASVRANYATFCDGLVDIGNDPHIGQEGQDSDTTYYWGDNCHFIANGYRYIATLVKPQVDALLP